MYSRCNKIQASLRSFCIFTPSYNYKPYSSNDKPLAPKELDQNKTRFYTLLKHFNPFKYKI